MGRADSNGRIPTRQEDKHPIGEILKHYGATVPSKRGGWQSMRCCFHKDSNASAGINQDINRFHCHGCGVSGDSYDIIVYKEGVSLNEAINIAESISGTGYGSVRDTDSYSRGVSRPPRSQFRGSKKVSVRSSFRSASWS